MRAAPIKPQYGPTLPQLLTPWWRRSSRATRGALAAASALALAIVVLVVLVTWPQTISRDGAVPYDFSYADHLHQVRPDPGSSAKVEARARGLLAASFAVAPVRLPPYGGDLEGELPLYAAGLIARLAAANPGFALGTEGKVRDNDVPGYTIDYSALRKGRQIFGRVVLLFPDRPHVRNGLVVTMLQRPSLQITTPDRVGVVGDLKLPFTTFQAG